MRKATVIQDALRVAGAASRTVAGARRAGISLWLSMGGLLLVLVYAGAVLLVGILLLAGCQRRELTYDYMDYAELQLALDWSGAGMDPAGATALVYTEDGDLVLNEPMSRDEQRIRLKPGIYKMIAFNSATFDFKNLMFRGLDRFETAEVCCCSAEIMGYTPRAEEQTVANPDMLAVAVLDRLVVTPEMVSMTAQGIRDGKPRSSDAALQVNLAPRRMVSCTDIKMHVSNLTYVRQARGVMTGFAGSMLLATGMSSERSVSQAFDFNRREYYAGSSTDGTLTGMFCTFGPCGCVTRSEPTYSFVFSVMLVDADRTRQDYTYDLTGKIANMGDNPLDGFTMEIGHPDDDLPPASVPEVEPEGDPGGGFDAGVEGWDDIPVVVPIG